MEQLACGQMGLSIDYFYNLTPRQFFNHQKGWADLRDAESKERMIFTRRLMYAALAPWSKNLKEQDIWPFDFEDQNQRSENIEAELQETLKYWDEIDNRRKNKPLQN